MRSKGAEAIWRRRGRLHEGGALGLLGFLAVLLAVAALPIQARAQGCIVAHSNGEVGGPENSGGYLQPGHWELDVDYRHQFSFIHYVGDVQQTYRLQQGTEVENRTNLEYMGLTYQFTPRWSATAVLPALEASRRKHDGIYSLSTSGIGDISATAQVWIWNPENNPSHNVQLGFGIQFPTGQDDIQNNIIAATGQAPQLVTPDYSVQPGIGGYGIPFQWIAFQNISSHAQFYMNGNYLITPQEMNHVRGNPLGFTPGPSTYAPYISVQDEYLMEAGIAYSFASVKGLSFTFGPRDEGVPARDLIGGNLGERRPGFALSLEPGLEYSRWNDMFSVTVARAIYRDRTHSVPEIDAGAPSGDAAFANWVWLAAFTHRF